MCDYNKRLINQLSTIKLITQYFLRKKLCILDFGKQFSPFSDILWSKKIDRLIEKIINRLIDNGNIGSVAVRLTL